MRMNKSIAKEVVAVNQIILPSGKTITLNDQQAEALRTMKEWLLRKDDLIFTLVGAAGSGKSTIVYELIKFFYDAFKWKRVAVSAPTHKARKVIARTTKEDSFTIQKLLGLRPNTELENYDINNPQFDEKAEKEIRYFKLLIIDEASMLNESLFKLILKEAEKYRTKVLMVGDEFQLPPINESISKIFSDIPSTFKLTKVERQQDSNPLMFVYDAIRSDIKTTTDLFEHKTSVNAKGEGIVFHSEQKAFENEVLPMFCTDEYRKDSDYIKLITYTNASVQAWNKRIRDYIYDMSWAENGSDKVLGAGALHPLIEGDILFAYNTVTIDRVDILIENSSDYKVQKVEDAVTDSGIDVHVVTLRSVDENIKSEINVVKKSAEEKFLHKFNHLVNYAKSQSGKGRGYAWRNYYDFKNNHLLMEDIKDAQGKLVVKKDVDYGYACTIHKIQGSTLTNIAISENNLDTNRNSEERNKLKYVAFSRPTTKAIILSNKAE